MLNSLGILYYKQIFKALKMNVLEVYVQSVYSAEFWSFSEHDGSR